MMNRNRLIGFLLAWASLTATAAELHVQDARVRETLPGQTVSAAYLTIGNAGQTDAVLLAVSSQRVPRVELHSLHHDNSTGTVQMRQEARLVVPAQGQLVLEPGGLHLMLLELPQPLRVGEAVDLTLVFEGEQRLSVEAPVKTLKETLPSSGHASHHGHH